MSENQKAALLSVSNKDGLLEFARFLVDQGYVLLSTSGTGSYLSEAGIESVSIEEYTAQPEILGGRVKTLHPKIHAGLLARRDNPEDMRVLKEQGIYPIDVAVVNLYPFEKHLHSETAQDFSKMIEQIDIGGPTMIRAAAKNHASVYAILNPRDYQQAMQILRNPEQASGVEARRFRMHLAKEVFASLAHYNLLIASYLSNVDFGSDGSVIVDTADGFELGDVGGVVLRRVQPLRYGENPHQKASFYLPLGIENRGWKQLQGKELSYNNLLDFDAAQQIIQSFEIEIPTCVIVKHLNPCGAAQGLDLKSALESAKKGDPRSHFGGILAFNQQLQAAEARDIAADFAELVIAPGYSAEALEVLGSKKNLRVIEVDFGVSPERVQRSAGSGILIQAADRQLSNVREARIATSRVPDEREYRDLQFAWTLCAHVKSNAISLAKNQMLLACGAGQMSRIDSVEVAIMKSEFHEHDLQGSVAASDAFFPFPDSVEKLAQAGVSAIVAPGGALKDSQVIEAAEKAGISLLLVEDRHFRH